MDGPGPAAAVQAGRRRLSPRDCRDRDDCRDYCGRGWGGRRPPGMSIRAAAAADPSSEGILAIGTCSACSLEKNVTLLKKSF